MWSPSLFLALGLAHQAASVLVYVSTYAGTVTTLDLTLPPNFSQDKAAVKQVAVHTGCAPNSSWLTLDKANDILYCLDEGLGLPNGTLSSYKTSSNGTLTQLQKVDVPSGPVYAVLYGAGVKGLAVAEYSGASLSTYLKDPEDLAELEQVGFALTQPGANASRQDAPHPHQVITDPTGAYFLVPDLGADLVRIFSINQTSLQFAASTPLVTPPGSGPRHAAFITAGRKTYLYLTSELVNTVTGYEVTYNANQTLSFTQVYHSSSYGLGRTVPEAASVAEIAASPDQRFLLVSTRSDHAFNITNFDATNSTALVSDSITSFKVDHSNGNLTSATVSPSGGLIPRQFAINKAGTLVGVGSQGSSRVVFINRNVATGELTGFAAAHDIDGAVTTVVFDE